MRILVTSDWHLDAVTAGVRRFSELEEAVRQAVSAAVTAKADLYLFLGDLCDPDSGSSVFRATEVAIRAAVELTRKSIPSVWLAGNHDVIEDGGGDTTLSPLRGLRHFDSTVVETPTALLLKGVWFVFLPFTASSRKYDADAFVRTSLRAPHLPPVPKVVAGHLSIPGIIPGEETFDMGRGREVLFPYDAAVEGGAALLLNGHYHRRKDHFPPLRTGVPGPLPIHIPGSLARLTFGEEGNAPAFSLIEVANA